MKRSRRQPDRGAVVPTVAIFMLLLLGFFSLAFNMGLIMDTRAELQNASDSAALAAARSLNGEASGLDAARRAANAYSRQHLAAGEEVLMDALGGDLVFGRWHTSSDECRFGASGADCFEPVSTTEPRKITAVKVYNGRDGEATHNDSIELPFGAFVGADTSSVDSAAVAVGAGSAVVECALPLAVAECKIVDDLNKLKCASGTPQRMVFASANADAVGFINMYYPEITQAPSGNWAADTIRERRCNPKHYRTGPAKLQNGDDFSKVIEALRGTSGNGGGSGGDSGGNGKGKGNDNGDNGGGNGGGATGPCLIGEPQTLAVTDAGCPGNPIFQNVQEVVGFVTARIVAVTDVQGNLLGCPGKPLPDVTGPFQKNSVIVDITCEATAGEGEWGGGRAYSSSSDVRVRLVD